MNGETLAVLPKYGECHVCIGKLHQSPQRAIVEAELLLESEKVAFSLEDLADGRFDLCSVDSEALSDESKKTQLALVRSREPRSWSGNLGKRIS